MKKTILFVLLCAIALSLFCCGNMGESDAESVTKNDEGEVSELLIAQNGSAAYKIIRDEDATQQIIDAVIYFRRALEEKTGVSFDLETDWLKNGTEYDMKSYEITVGITNRNSEDAVKTLGIMDYNITVNGSKIEILARSEKVVRTAVDIFLSECTVNGGNVSVSGLPISGKCEFSDGEIPYYEFGDIENIYESSENTSVIKATGTTAEDYAAYLDILHEAGFEDYASNKIGDRLFTTLTDDSTNISFYYINGVTRIAYEPKRALFTREQDNIYQDAGIEPLLTGMKGETSVAAEGMGFIIRLCDGSFVIIDGGMGDPNHVDADKLYNILMEQSPDGTEKPVIAAWLFTHLHGDHIGVFNCFSIDYHDKIELEAIYYNFPKDEEVAASDSPYMLDDTIYRYTQFRKCREEYYSDVKYVKVHTGDKLYVRNAVFEVLSTLEDIYPKTILDGGMNESSVLYKMTLGGQTTLWTGDIAFIAADVALKQFGDYLKCDMLQLAHHGMNGTVDFYSAVDPEYTFLPVWEGGFDSMKGYAQNQWLIKSEKMKQMIVTGFGTWTIKLPYAPADGSYDRLPNAKTVYPSYSDLK